MEIHVIFRTLLLLNNTTKLLRLGRLFKRLLFRANKKVTSFAPTISYLLFLKEKCFFLHSFFAKWREVFYCNR